MSSAFTAQEKTAILTALKGTARKCAATIGMRKTTVDQLAQSAGISKGAFYKFYETKEHLFFEVLEDWHTEVYGNALQILLTRTDLSDKKRMMEAILQACRIMEENSMMDFFENDMPYLLRKIPSKDLKKHYHSDDVHIEELIKCSGISMTKSAEVVSATVRGLFLTLSHRKQIGGQYQQVLEILVQGACEQLVV